MRTFIAIRLPEEIISGVTAIQRRLRTHPLNVRWVAPENIHLTLAFLGDISSEEMENVFRAVTETAQTRRPLSLCASGVGTFPTAKRPRVIWVGVGGETDRLVGLKTTLDNRLHGALNGFKKEKKQYHAHLTLGRVKGRADPGRLGTVLAAFHDYRSDTFVATHMHIFSSRLTPRGAVYTILNSIPLQGAPHGLN